MNNYKPVSILHAFDPNLLLHNKYHEEVRFVWGRYLDIATQKGKDPRSLYFGTSKNSDLLTGIFLGDYELTSKIKDVSLESQNNNVVLTIKFIDNNGKLTTVKSKLPSNSRIDNVDTLITNLQNLTNKIIKKINVINSSIYLIEHKLDSIDTSISDITQNLEDGNYNYTIHQDTTDFSDGLRQKFTLFKGENEQVDSSVIIVNDYILKKLEYDTETNKLTAISWPDAIGDDIYEYEYTTDIDGNEQIIKTNKLNDEHIKKVEMNLDAIEQHFLNTVNTNSSVNDRLIFVENQLQWENLFG